MEIVAHYQPTHVQSVPEQWTPHPNASPSIFYAEHNSMCYGVYHASVGVSCIGFVLFPHFGNPQPQWWDGERSGKVLCQYCSAVNKTSCYCQHKSKTQTDTDQRKCTGFQQCISRPTAHYGKEPVSRGCPLHSPGQEIIQCCLSVLPV